MDPQTLANIKARAQLNRDAADPLPLPLPLLPSADPQSAPPATRSLATLNIPDQPPLPDWLTALHPHQWDAVEETVAHFRNGASLVWLDAPTGSGKTLIGEAVRRIMAADHEVDRALYVCSDRALQDQFVADFPYAKVLKGRANYPTLDGSEAVNCGDCTRSGADSSCNWCHNPARCPYLVAKMTAIKAPLSVLNTAYLLAEANSAGVFAGRGLTIVDECDVLEQVLMGFVEFKVPDRTLKKMRLKPPPKGSHHKTLLAWIEEVLKPSVVELKRRTGSSTTLFGTDVAQLREVNGLNRLLGSIEVVLDYGQDSDNWVRDNDAGPMVLKPVRVDKYGQDVLWRHSKRWLCMSATIISPDQMADSLGVKDGEWETVRVPMTFPLENRPIIQIPVAGMTYKEKETAEPEMVRGCQEIIDMHPGERVLVHAVSYHLAETISRGLRGRGRDVFTYTKPAEKEQALARYRRTPGSVLVASSMDRGVDLKGDDCRVVIVAKIPYPSLKDSQVSKRLHGAGGEEWYAVQTVRTIVQMTGRGVRNKEDWAKTYVLDSQFGMNVYKKNSRLFPKWWRDAVRFVPRHHLTEGRVQ